VTERFVTAAGLLFCLSSPQIVFSQAPAWQPVSTGVTARLRALSAVSPRVF
jgi:hypothetical protein